MTIAVDPPKESFRLSMLIYDTRYRAMTIQVIVLGLVLLFVGWLTDNTIQNLAENIARGLFSCSHQRARRGVDLAGRVIHDHNVDIVDFEIDFFDAPRFFGHR